MEEYTNSKEWLEISDGWVATMNKSKEAKEKYREYLKKYKLNAKDLPYVEWLNNEKAKQNKKIEKPSC